MRAFHIVAGLAALALAGAGEAAPAQTKAPANAPALSQDWTVKDGKKSLQWSDGRWGLKLDQERPVGRATHWDDVQAGAFFKLSPSLRVGGTVGLSEMRSDPGRPVQEEKAQPKVRLETTFRF